MANVRTRPESGNLYVEFRYRGKRCREQTILPDTPSNRRTVEALARRIKTDLARGTFDYGSYFPGSPRVEQFRTCLPATSTGSEQASEDTLTPTFVEFAEIWFEESTPRWRDRYQTSMRDTLEKYLFPAFGEKPLGQITRGDLLAFRAEFAKRPGHGGRSLSPQRINKVVGILRSIITEGCDRYGLVSPGRGIKPLKQSRPDIHPFTLEEIDLMLARIRPDYQPYLVTRFYTGLRTGEVNGLQWDDIDFEQNIIEVRRTASRDGDGGLKTTSSRRVVPMVPQVRDALLRQRASTVEQCPWVFSTSTGRPVDAVNFTNRVWYPLLRHLGLARRNPYQTRHTAATLMLASGENPEWVARVLGHSTTEMLFRVYSRYIPNITRQDGRAFVGMLSAKETAPKPPEATMSLAQVEGMSPEQMRELLQSVIAMVTPTLEGSSHEED